jgi:hypothetical protein
LETRDDVAVTVPPVILPPVSEEKKPVTPCTRLPKKLVPFTVPNVALRVLEEKSEATLVDEVTPLTEVVSVSPCKEVTLLLTRLVVDVTPFTPIVTVLPLAEADVVSGVFVACVTLPYWSTVKPASDVLLP